MLALEPIPTKPILVCLPTRERKFWHLFLPLRALVPNPQVTALLILESRQRWTDTRWV
jgi:hypothetical protein